MNRGDVRWYKFPRPDKDRPVVILTRDSASHYLGEVTIAPITTTIRDIPSEVLLDTDDGMPKRCAMNCDHLQTVSRSRIGPMIASLSKGKMEQVSAAIAFALELDG